MLQKLLVFIFFASIFIAIILYGRGYKLDINKRSLQATGIIVASSNPDGAKIYIDGVLKAATNENITLSPGSYEVRIEKQGYSPWKKNFLLRGEWVVKANPDLFPVNPSLSPVTNSGVNKAFPAPSGDYTVFVSETGNAELDGVYQLNHARRTLGLTSELKLLALRSSLPSTFDLKTSTFSFSPSEDEILITAATQSATTLNKLAKPTDQSRSYLITRNQLKQSPFDVTRSVANLKEAWRKDQVKKNDVTIASLPNAIRKIALQDFEVIGVSKDEKKLLYKSLVDTTLPQVLQRDIPGTNQTREERNLREGLIYVYDREEDKNYLISSIPTELAQGKAPTHTIVTWHPNSKNLLINEGNTISVIDYDNTNKRTLYSGSYHPDYFSVSNEGNVFILANLNAQSNVLPNFYVLGTQ
ncbi:MAG: PEGA domain protein [Microgenomates bacterium OLB22]|nr:MAG: PEGA domain protein [Microgenomates bacterium OLB22]